MTTCVAFMSVRDIWTADRHLSTADRDISTADRDISTADHYSHTEGCGRPQLVHRFDTCCVVAAKHCHSELPTFLFSFPLAAEDPQHPSLSLDVCLFYSDGIPLAHRATHFVTPTAHSAWPCIVLTYTLARRATHFVTPTAHSAWPCIVLTYTLHYALVGIN